MKPRARLQGRGRFSQIYRDGRTWSHRLLVLKALPNGMPESCFGFAVGKSLGGAVFRNRLRRRMREIVRRIPVHPGWDAIFIARADAVDASFPELAEAASGLLGRAGLKIKE